MVKNGYGVGMWALLYICVMELDITEVSLKRNCAQLIAKAKGMGKSRGQGKESDKKIAIDGEGKG